MKISHSYIKKGEAPFPFTKDYLELQENKDYKSYLIEDQEIKIPILVKQKYIFKIAQLLYPPLKKNHRINKETEKQFLDKLVVFLKKEKICDGIEPPLHIATFKSYPKSSYVTDIGLITLGLENSDIEAVFSKFNSKNRTQIRKAIREGVLIEEGNHFFTDFYTLYSENLKKQNLPYDSYKFIKDFLKSVGTENYFILKASFNGQTEGILIIITSKSEAYYYYGASATRTQFKGSNKLLQYEVLKKLYKKNIKRYCFGGARLFDIKDSKFEGIQNFKLSFGSEIEKGYHFKIALNFKYKLYIFLLKYYLKLRGIKPQKGFRYEKK